LKNRKAFIQKGEFLDYFGYAGRILKINLSDESIEIIPLPKELVREYIGGRSINTKILYDKVPAGMDPFDAKNRVVFGVGPLVGTIAPSSGRYNVTTKSAITRIFGDSNSGGHWAPELKHAGFDHIVLFGQAEKPLYLWISDGDAKLRDASHLWGKDTWETTEAIHKELGDPDIQVLCIGPAGENLVKYACLINNLARAPGRGGAGALLGAKKLKAIAIRGTMSLRASDPDTFIQIVERLFSKIKSHPGAQLRSIYGTPMLTKMTSEKGFFGAKNFQVPKDDLMADALSGERFVNDYSLKSKACFNCPIHCGHYYGVTDGPYRGTFGEGIEYDAVLELGIKANIKYFPAIFKMNELTNRYGIDLDSLGGIVSWAMESFERGVLSLQDTGGLDLSFGNHESYIQLIHDITYRKGLGDLLAEDLMTIVSRVGKGSEKWACHIKGLSMITELRMGYGFALAHGISNIGAHHLRGTPMAEHDEKRMLSEGEAEKLFGDKLAQRPDRVKGKGPFVRWNELSTAIADSVGMCKFATTPYAGKDLTTHEDLAELLTALTGTRVTLADLETAAERAITLERCFNAREGLDRSHDTLPPRMWEPVKEGPLKGFTLGREEWGDLLDQYYQAHNWGENGVPTRESLENLGLGDVANELERLGCLGIPYRK
jgi:aldehyde:ferredoxin oxidoreductase